MKQLKLVLVFAASLFFSACNQKPIKYHPISEIKEGPGLFTGEDGAFNIHNQDKNEQPDKQEAAQPLNQQEYQSFKDWQAAKKSQEYQEFKAWQKTKASEAPQPSQSIPSESTTDKAD